MNIRIKISDLWLSSLIFIFVVCFPLNYFASSLDPIYISLIQLFLRLFLFGYNVHLIAKYHLPIFNKPNFIALALCTPFLLACFTNLFSDIFANVVITNFELKWIHLIEVLIIIFTVLNEEILFRFFIYNQLNIRNKLLKIMASAGIFASFHLLNLLTPSFLAVYQSVLIQVIYTFGLGLILGFIYEYGKSIVACMVFHFLFNFFNQYLVTYHILGFFENGFIPYIIALVIGLLLVGYGLLIYFLKFKKEDDKEIYYY